MAGRTRAADSRWNSGDGPKKQQQEVWPEEISLNRLAAMQAYLLLGVTGLGYLALLWSTVVLLGGFVTALGKKDFWCLTALSMMQATRIFNDYEDEVVPNFFKKMVPFFNEYFIDNNSNARIILFFPTVLLLMSMITVFNIIYGFGPFIIVGISLWRVIKRDYGNMDGDSTRSNLMPAMDIFYSLVLCQGALFFLYVTTTFAGISFVDSLQGVCEFPEMWGRRSVEAYHTDTRSKYWRDPKSREDRTLIKYAVDLLDSESSQGYLSGSRMLDVFIKCGVDVRSLILPSSQKVQKLIDTLRWRSSDTEIKELAARILAHLACEIDLTQFPGIIRCISSLLGTTLPYWNNQQGSSNQSPQNKWDQQRTGDSEGAHWNELILQGLIILERLASDQHNCRDICSTPDLIAKVMSPMYSDTLIQDINIMPAWQEVVNGAFRVVYRLIRATEWTGRRLAHEISCSEQAVSNLEGILDQGSTVSQELQIRVIEILTELALDSSTNLATETKEKLIKKQLRIFLDEGTEESLRVAAGKSLALLFKTGTISVCLLNEYSYTVDQVTEILDAKNNIIYRTIAAEILENLCTQHKMDNEHVKNILLPKVLTEVLTSKNKPPAEACQRKSHWLARLLPANMATEMPQYNDEENQRLKHNGQINSSEQNETQTAMMELKEVLLSLTLVIFEKLIINADDFDDVIRKVAPGEGEFVAKLNTIVEENCQATASSLRIVKLCGQIAVLILQHSQNIVHFKDQKFVESLSMASIIMSNLESCMLFAGTDCGAKKTVRPLLSDLVKEAQALIA